MNIGLEIVIILLLIIVNGLFAMSELALVSVRRARLAVMEKTSVPGAAKARALSDNPHRFLPTIQVGITLVSVLTGVFGGAAVAGHVKDWLETIPRLEPFADTLSLGMVVIVTTYMTLVLGELVPKQIALRQPEVISAWVARPLTIFIRIAGPVAWLLSEIVRPRAASVRPAPAAGADRHRGRAQSPAGRGRTNRRAGTGRAGHDRAGAASRR